MNPAELKAQILKYKARRSKIRLAHYGTAITIPLALSVFGNGFTWASLISFLITLPLPLYFAHQSVKFARKTRALKDRMRFLESKFSSLESKFSFKEFLTQPSFAFRFSLILFFLVCLTTFARVRSESPTLTLNPESSYIDHRPSAIGR